MADKYKNFSELARKEVAGVDYRVLLRRATPSFAIVAPHGGGIEPGTSEIADAVAESDLSAGTNLSFYAFEAIKSGGNKDLHITSTNFDESMCLALIKAAEIVITIHGEHSDEDSEGVFVGGLDKRLGQRLGSALKSAGFLVGRHKSPKLQGLELNNLCNRGKKKAGVQLELSQNVRKQLFVSLTREGRKKTKPAFGRFVKALRSVIA
jgi:phage replication-related protein YjqB (UPF0714/DUF867 family)